MNDIFTLAFLFSVLRMATPMIFTAMGGMIGERAGVIQIGLEGMMLMGSLFAAIGALATHSAWIGFLLGGLAGAIMGGLYAWTVIDCGANQIVSGTAFNLLGFGLTPFICKASFGSTGSTPGLPAEARFEIEPILIAFVTVFLLHHIFRKTGLGLFVRFAGEKSLALLAAGISVKKVRYSSVIICGWLAGLGGAVLSTYLSSGYSSGMTAGRGFMALAAIIFGGWKPLPTMIACLFFAFVDALQIQLQMADSGLPLQLVQVFPYAITLIAIGVLGAKSKSPKELGQLFSR